MKLCKCLETLHILHFLFFIFEHVDRNMHMLAVRSQIPAFPVAVVELVGQEPLLGREMKNCWKG